MLRFGWNTTSEMATNPTSLTVTTPDSTEIIENVETWWRSNGDLIVKTKDGEEHPFLLGVIEHG